MRFHILASDYDGTLAHHERVSEATLEKLEHLKRSNRKLVLVTGRELPDLERVFPEYGIFDHIVAENGALLYTPSNGKEELLGPAPDEAFVNALKAKGVAPVSVGKVIVATWEPHQNTALDVIKDYGIERQVIFNKGAVMILPPGINKATGLQAFLQRLHYSDHNIVAIGDAENDSAMMQVVECAVAVSNALPALKDASDHVTAGDHGKGVIEIIDALVNDDLAEIISKQTRNNIVLGKYDENEFSIKPHRPGILLTGSSGGGKSTLTVAIAESLAQRNYQYCLIDPEGDYLEMPDTVIIGNEKNITALEEIIELLKNPKQNLVVCIMSIPMGDRPAFFSDFLLAFMQLKKDSGHPHWLLIDEAHHVAPSTIKTTLPEGLDNFLLISVAVDEIDPSLVEKVSTVMVVGEDSAEPLEKFCIVRGIERLKDIPAIRDNEACIYDVDTGKTPYVIKYNPPTKLQQRHKRKYAHGEMGENSFIFTGKKSKLNLKANNLAMFTHLAEGIDDDTWVYHLKEKDFRNWFELAVNDDELAAISKEAENKNAAESKKIILDYIRQKYMA